MAPHLADLPIEEPTKCESIGCDNSGLLLATADEVIEWRCGRHSSTADMNGLKASGR
jgi:hypothetical protein